MREGVMLDHQRMFEHACAFCDCAEFCEVEPNNIQYRTHFHTVSGIVNSAFACEVFIKSLLVLHGKTVTDIKCHELKILWDKFKVEDCETALSVESSLREWFDSKNENMFDELISEVSNSFEYWRYIYEQQNSRLNINFLKGFRCLLREICCMKFFEKSWDEYKNRE